MRRSALPLACALAACSGEVISPPERPHPRPSPPPSAASTAVAIDACPAQGWCWVRGRPLTVDGEDGRLVAFGGEGALLRWDGAAWNVRTAPTARALISVIADGDATLWAIDDGGSAWHHDGAAWTERPARAPLLRLLGAADGAMWALGVGEAGAHGDVAGGAILRWDEGEAGWVTAVPSRAYCLGGDVTLVDGAPWSTGLACDAQQRVTGAEVHRFDGTAWAPVGALIEGQGWYPRFERLGGRLVVRASGIFAWDGATWSRVEAPAYPQDLAPDEVALWDGYTQRRARRWQCSAAHATASGDAWCFGAGQLFRADGDGWRATLADPYADTQTEAAPELPPALWAGGETDLAWRDGNRAALRARAGGPLERWDGARWVETPAPHPRVVDIDGAGATEAWVTVDGGVVRAYGGRFNPLDWPAGIAAADTRAPRVRALGGDRAVVVTDHALLERDATTWTTLREAEAGWTLVDVAGTGLDDLWLTEVRWSRPIEGRLAHFDGRTWSVQALGDALGEVATFGDETWLAVDVLSALGEGAAGASLTRPRELAGGRLWVDEAAVWLTTPTQALRWPRR